jgi:hypothetical protein
MSKGTVVLVGNLSSGALRRLAPKFDWLVEEAHSFKHLEEICDRHRVVAVLFEPYSFGISWPRALQSVLDSAPAALPIVCHRISDVIDWPTLADAGAFHAIPVPLNESEVRLSLGFVWGARSEQQPQSPVLYKPREINRKRAIA